MKLTMFVIIMMVGWIPGALAGIGVIAGVQGDARVIRQAASLPATVGLVVELNDRLVTGKKSRIKVLFSDDSLITVGGKTELTITKHLFNAPAKRRETIVELAKGKMRALVQKEVAGVSGVFEVHTTNAIAGVRGTEFVVSTRDTKTKLWTISGDMDLIGSDGSKKIVVAGEGCEVLKGVGMAPYTVAQAELNKVRSQTDMEQSPTALALNLDIGAPDQITPPPAGERIKSNERWSQEPTFVPKIEGPSNNQVTTFYGTNNPNMNTSISSDVQNNNWIRNNKPSGTSQPSNIIITIKIPK